MAKKIRAKNGLKSRFARWLLGDELPTANQALRELGLGRSLADLPASYDTIPLPGDKYIHGKCCKTVGDYKDALGQDPTGGGWHD